MGSVYTAVSTIGDLACSKYGKVNRVVFVTDGDESEMVECCHELLIALRLEHPVGEILREAVSSFHSTYGCSTRTLLVMARVWYGTLHQLLDMGVEKIEAVDSLHSLLSISLSSLSTFCLPLPSPVLPWLAPLVARGDLAVSQALRSLTLPLPTLHYLPLPGLARHRTQLLGSLAMVVENREGFRSNSRLATLLLHGDLTATHRHTGYKRAFTHQQILTSMPSLETTDWTQRTLEIITELSARVVLLSGHSDPVLASTLRSRGVLVVERTPYHLLKVLSNAAQVPIHTSLEFLTSAWNVPSGEGSSVPNGEDSYHDGPQARRDGCLTAGFQYEELDTQLKSSQSLLKISSNQLSAHATLLACAPATQEAALISERFSHAIRRLESILASRSYLPGGVALSRLAQIHRRHADTECDAVQSLAHQVFSDHLVKYICTHNEPDGQEHIDPVTPTLAACEYGLEAAVLCSNLSSYVRTGIDKNCWCDL